MLSVRELQHSDIPFFLRYWYTSEESFLVGMGLDVSKLPPQEKFASMLETLLATPIEQRMSYCIVWLKDGAPIGHCNTNPTTFGEEAKMHLHLWHSAERKKGMGTALVKMTLPYFFNNLRSFNSKLSCCPVYSLPIR